MQQSHKTGAFTLKLASDVDQAFMGLCHHDSNQSIHIDE